MRSNAELMPLVRDVPRRRRRSTTCAWAAGRPRRGARAVRLPRVPHALGPPRRGRRRRELGPATRPAADVLEAEVAELADVGRRPRRGLADAGRGRRGRLAVAGPWAGAPRPLGRCVGARAACADAAPAEVRRACRRGLLDDAERAGRRSSGLVAAGGRPLAAHDAKALMRALLGRGIDVRTLAARHRARRLPARPGRVAATCSSDLLLRYAAARAARRRRRPRRAARPRRRRRRRRARGRPAGPLAVARLRRPLARRARRPGPARALRRDRGAAGAGAGPHGARRRRRRRRRAARASTTQLAAECAELDARRSRTAPARSSTSTPRRSCATILFDKLGLHARRRRPRPASPPTPRRSRSCAGEHPIIEHLLRYREVEKLRSTYGEGLLAEVGARRPHPRHVQPDRGPHRAAQLRRSPTCTTSRCAVRGGPALPAGVRARPTGCEFLVADYNQIELRVHRPPGRGPRADRGVRAAAPTSTPRRRRASSASSPADVTDRPAVQGQDGLLRAGLRDGGLRAGPAARHRPAPRPQEILDAYFVAFPAVRAYMDETVAEARERGYTETLFGRRRQIPELASSNFRIRQAGERQAMNAGIQGLAADIFKVALVRLDHALERGRPGQPAHPPGARRGDPRGAARRARAPRGHARRHVGAVDLRVPLEVNLSSASWADAKG